MSWFPFLASLAEVRTSELNLCHIGMVCLHQDGFFVGSGTNPLLFRVDLVDQIFSHSSCTTRCILLTDQRKPKRRQTETLRLIIEEQFAVNYKVSWKSVKTTFGVEIMQNLLLHLETLLHAHQLVRPWWIL